MKQSQQLEIALPNKPCRRPYRSRTRRLRARWWFNQMRAVVDDAVDWKAAAAAGEQQTYLTLKSESQ